MDERRIVVLLENYFSSAYNYAYFHLLSHEDTEAVVARVFHKMVILDSKNTRKDERILLFQLVQEELNLWKSEQIVPKKRILENQSLSALDKILLKITWEERGMLYLLCQDIENREIADILRITITQLQQRKLLLARRLKNMSMELD